MDNQQLINSIRQHIVGTWEHDGDCPDMITQTSYDDLTLRDNMSFGKSEHETFTFSADGKVHLVRNVDSIHGIWEKHEFDGDWEVSSRTINTDGDDLLPPYGIKIDYHTGDGFATTKSDFSRILFSSDFNTMYLNEMRALMRYVRK